MYVRISFSYVASYLFELSRFYIIIFTQPLQFPSSGNASYQTLQNELSSCAAAHNAAGTVVVAAARGTPEQQAVATKKFSDRFEELLTAGLTLAGASKDKQSQQDMLGYLRTISVSSSKLLLAAKAISADPNAPNVMNQLAAAARAVTDAINSLLNLCSSSGPGQKECDNALRNIEVCVIMPCVILRCV